MSEKELILKSFKDLKKSLSETDLEELDIQRYTGYLRAILKSIEDQRLKLTIEKEYNQKEKDQINKSFNGLTAREWTQHSRNVWDDLSSPRKKHHLTHGATYPEALTDRLIRMYSKKEDLVFDPFLGTGTTLISAKKLNRKGIGIELSKEFYKYSIKQLKEASDLFNTNEDISVYNDDCRNLEKYLQDETVQLTVTSPPYANFIIKSIEDRKKTHKTSLIKFKNNSTVRQYTKKKTDFGNLEYPIFLNETKLLLDSIYQKTKIGGYNIWIIKDHRDTKNSIPYINFHSDLANLGEEVGFKLHDLIVWDQNEQRSLVLLGYPSVFYTNQNCSFIVVMRKS